MRKSFRCRFNQYVGSSNQDSVVAGILSQFQGYNCNPEVTLDGDELILTVDITGDVTNTLVRDKLAFNYFIQSVRVSDGINKIRRMVLPTPISSWVEATVVGEDRMNSLRDGDEDDLGVELPEGARPDISKLIGGSGFVTTGGIKQADPQGNLVVPPFSGTDESVDPDLLSDIHDVTAFRIATEQDGGGLAGFGGGIDQTNVRTSPTNPPRETKPPQNSILGVPTNSWFTDDILAGETITPNPNAEAPLSLPTGSKRDVGFEDTALDLPGAAQGGEFVPGDEDIKGWFTAFRQIPTYFGLGDEYGKYDDDEL
jgi:hypothetical protein